MDFWTILMIVAIIVFIIIPSFKPRTFPVKKLLILPAVFLYLFYDNLAKTFHLSSGNILLIIIGIALGAAIGFYSRRDVKIIADYKLQLISVAGSYASLVLFIIIFSAHFVIGYYQAIEPIIFQQNTSFAQFLLLALTITSSLSIGTNGCLYYKYLQGK